MLSLITFDGNHDDGVRGMVYLAFWEIEGCSLDQVMVLLLLYEEKLLFVNRGQPMTTVISICQDQMLVFLTVNISYNFVPWVK